MGFYFTKLPSILQDIFPGIIWKLKGTEYSDQVYLTFDDGPNEKSTGFILDILSKRNIKGTFFLTGEKAAQNPYLMTRIADEGHTIGNHGYRHEDPIFQSMKEFKADVRKGKEMTGSDLYRPPYGRLGPAKYNWVKRENQIVLWNRMPGDFDPDVSEERLGFHLREYTGGGDVIVLHDNEKSIEKLRNVLPESLDYLVEKGFEFNAMSEINAR